MTTGAPLRLGTHVLAHLRAVAQGIAPGAAARRYLVNSFGDGAALARRSGLGPSWRLLRVAQLPDQLPAARPSLEEWAEAKGYQDFSETELLPLYLEQN